MKAVLLVPEQESTHCPRVPSLALFPLLDRPFLQHIVEAIARRGIREVLIFHGQGSESIRHFLGEGTRWGCKFSYYQVADPARPEPELRTLSGIKEPILIGRADQLPPLPTVLRTSERGLLFGTDGNWSGWAVLSDTALLNVSIGSSLFEHFSSQELNWVDVGEPISLRTLADVPHAQRALLLAQLPGLLVSAHETRLGLWVGRNVRIDPSAKLEPPVFIGDNTVVAAGAKVGPEAVIGADCMLSRDSSVRETTVCTGTYVGAGVELSGVIVDGRCLVNPQKETATTVDRNLLDRLAPGVPLPGSVSLLLAGVASVCAIPVLVAAALWRRRPTRAVPVSPELPTNNGDVVANGKL